MSPVNRAGSVSEIYMGKFSSRLPQAHGDLGRRNRRDIGNLASPASHMNEKPETARYRKR